MATERIPIGSNRKENLAEMVARYKRLAEPKIVQAGLMYFTLQQDLKLYKLLVQDPKHPKDTGLLKNKWALPALPTGGGVTEIEITKHFQKYKPSFSSGKFNVYLLNEATVGEQQRLKYQKEGWGHFKKKKVRGSYKLKRYFKFVEQRTGFYSKKLRIVRQQLNSEWKKFVVEYLYERFERKFNV